MLLCFLLCVSIASGFRPNHESGDVAPSDYTDTDITEMGVLQAVAVYMEKNPLPGRSARAPGELENMKPLNATGLFKAYFQADVSAIRFAKAVQEIVTGNNLVEAYHHEDSSFFFYCEQISKSINQLRILKDSMLSGLKGEVNTSTLESARLSAGIALHVLQKFYSNTNWVEMENRHPYKYLVNAKSTAFPAAPASMRTCRDCMRGSSGRFVCDGNILVRDLLTSAYKISRTCRFKPPGKCGHGGITDVSQGFPPTGGINKETSNPALSPHYYLHQQAAELAIEATKSFFVGEGYGLLSQVGNEVFKKFFSLEGYSLTFVIDTTGSMADDIRQVKASCIELLRNYSGSPDAPFNYILVPFNDPDVGPVFKTHNVDELESAISRLVAVGGGDCPEMSLTGVKMALQESLPRSKIFVFTDAGPKDLNLTEENKILIDSSESKVNYILTGYCSSRKRKSPPREEPGGIYANPYEELAIYSGGFYVQTTKSQLSQVLGLMELSLNSALVKLAYSRNVGSRFSFAVDESVKEMTISIKGKAGFTVQVLQPSGSLLTPLTMLINTASYKVVKVSPIRQQGLWTVVMSPRGSYEVEVEGKSLLDFGYQILEELNKYLLPIRGRPVKGSKYTLSLKVMGETAGTRVQRLVLISGPGTPRKFIALNQSFDALGNLLAVANVSLHGSRTLVGIEGMSPGNLPFSRISSDPIIPESVKLVSLPDQNGTLAPGESLKLSVVVVNDGALAHFDFKVWDDMDFLRSFTPTEGILDTGENITLTATLVAPVENSSFASSIVTFTAKSAAAQNYLKLPITVTPEIALETDEIPPVHKVIEFYMPCSADLQRQPNCGQQFWSMIFSAQDDESAVTVRINTNPSGLSCTPKGADGKKVECRYRSNCCSPFAEVLISDEDGNTSTFTMDYRKPRPPSA